MVVIASHYQTSSLPDTPTPTPSIGSYARFESWEVLEGAVVQAGRTVMTNVDDAREVSMT